MYPSGDLNYEIQLEGRDEFVRTHAWSWDSDLNSVLEDALKKSMEINTTERRKE